MRLFHRHFRKTRVTPGFSIPEVSEWRPAIDSGGAPDKRSGKVVPLSEPDITTIPCPVSGKTSL